MAKKNLFGAIALFRGNETTSTVQPTVMPFTRPLTMPELKMLWDAERALNSLPMPAGYRVVIDVDVQ